MFALMITSDELLLLFVGSSEHAPKNKVAEVIATATKIELNFFIEFVSISYCKGHIATLTQC
jgi:hypothetical protein